MQRIKTAAVFSKFGPDKRLFVLMLVVTVIITIDSEIGYVADFIPGQISSNTGVFVFILIAVIFVITQYLILDYVKHLNKETRQRVPHLSKLHSGVFFCSIFACWYHSSCNFANTINAAV